MAQPATPPAPQSAPQPAPALPPAAPIASGPDAAAPASDPAAAPALQPQDFTPRGMFLHAGPVVKGVITLLGLACLLTWVTFIAKSLELSLAGRRLRAAFVQLRAARSLREAEDKLDASEGAARALLRGVLEEWTHSADVLADREGLKERIALHLGRIEAACGRRMARGTGLLATIGATAPFVGLFGTVWGIMSSFIGIARLHSANLAVVAPGIAEALMATAIGLVAAIPAVVIYNVFARRISLYKATLADAGVVVMRLASRDLSRTGEAPGLQLVAE